MMPEFELGRSQGLSKAASQNQFISSYGCCETLAFGLLRKTGEPLTDNFSTYIYISE